MCPSYSEARSYFFFRGTPCREGRCCCPSSLTQPSLAGSRWHPGLHWTSCIYQVMEGSLWRGHMPRLPSGLRTFIEVGISKPFCLRSQDVLKGWCGAIYSIDPEAKARSQVPVSYCVDTQTHNSPPNQISHAGLSPPLHIHPPSPKLEETESEEAESKAELWFTYSANQLFLWANPGPPCPEGLPWPWSLPTPKRHCNR